MKQRDSHYSVILGVGAFLLLWSSPSLAAGPPADISKMISDYAQIALGYAAILASVATISMAFVELVKGVFDLRRWFQQVLLHGWLGRHQAKVLPELLFLAIGDKKHESVLCGQPLEKMMGQLQAAARIALDYPEKFPALFEFLSSTDFEESATDGTPSKVAPEDRQVWREHATMIRSIGAQMRGATTTEAPAADVKSASDAAQARARVASLVGRKLDGFQLRVQFWWERSNQAFSIVLSILLLELALTQWASSQDHVASAGHVFLLGLIGGMLAPFAKDFSQALTRLGSK